jgi:4-hydroxy-tetrahydrodipicolinate reductase
MGQMVAVVCGERGLEIASGADMLAHSDAVIDFTSPSAVETHARAFAGAGIPWILGTTGLAGLHQDLVAVAAAAIPVVQAANFSPGVALVLAAARMLARALPGSAYDAEIVEMHHRQKRDSPSGTALALARAVAQGRGLDPSSVRPEHDRSGAREVGTIGFASLRAGEVVGRHSILFAGDLEHITLSHEALDRRVFAAGAVRAALWAVGRPPGLYGMADVLGLDTILEGAS